MAASYFARGALVAGMMLTFAAPAAAGEAAALAAEPSSEPTREQVAGERGEASAADFLPLDCQAEQTGGFHDYPDDDESYGPALFNSTPFRLDENEVFMLNLRDQPGVDLFVSLTSGDDPVTTELECRHVRGIDGSPGFSCVNIPPSEMLLINRKTLRFTRTAVGGWTFAGATEASGGDSIFVEYGACKPAGEQ